MKKLMHRTFMEHTQWASIFAKNTSIDLSLLAVQTIEALSTAMCVDYSERLTMLAIDYKREAFIKLMSFEP